MAAILSLLAGGVSLMGPLALFGGPVGIAVAWIGSMVANKTVKWVAILCGLVLLVGTTIGLTVHVEHLEQDRAAYRLLKAEHESLEVLYGCPARPAHERDLAACMTARDRDAEHAKADEIARQRLEAAQEQSRVDRESAEARAAEDAADQAIEQGATSGDGPVPPVLLQSWKRLRAEQGLK